MSNLLVEATNYLLSNFDTFVDLLREHLILVLVAQVGAILVAVTAGILATRNERTKTWVLSSGNISQTVPPLAVIALVFPFVGIGFNSALLAMWVYALLPIITNTIAGIEDVDEGTIRAAKGMGMTDSEILRQIQLPLAVPVIFAGIRTSTVMNVGTAYLAIFIGAGGLGDWVVTGIQLFNTPQILAGAIPGAVLAISLDTILGVAERNLDTQTTQSGGAVAEA
ncbi:MULTISPECIES: ABC transporter permease [Haloferax]|uniref:Glycine/betaine ABC transporter n=1 Tax=Haloferax marisrubri TaxID=1544719 RepID=A0A2P4NMD1_9EURY|nr:MULTISPECIES: ABC transporter permease [Haloferax]POG54268.1 glycine/betaine ABC transporter [Haloferax marisrubri]